MFEESEQAATDGTVSLAQPPAISIGRREHHNGIERAVELAQIAATRAFGQRGSSPGQHDSPSQQWLHARREDRVAGVDLG
jgi:hypothetical protein